MDKTIRVSFETVHAAINGGGIVGLQIESTPLGNTASGASKILATPVSVSPEYLIKGVRVCSMLDNSRTFISQIQLEQVANPPDRASILLNDKTPMTNEGPVCMDTQETTIDPSLEPVLLSLRVNFGDTKYRIVIRSLGLRVVRK